MSQLDLFSSNSDFSPAKSNLSVDEAKLTSVCLFSSAGIGELGVEAAGISILAANEIVPNRVALYQENFPDSDMFAGDIQEKSNVIVDHTVSKLRGDDLFLLYATPPCQGMSTNGMGRLKWEVEQGRRKVEDDRNRLIIPTMDVACALQPKWLLLENVPGMRHTEIRTELDQYQNIISYMQSRLGSDYTGGSEVIACQDYGVAQRRKRLITIFTRDPKGRDYFKNNGGTFFPSDLKEQPKSLREAIGHLPELDAVEGRNSNYAFHPLHYVPIMNATKYWWVSHTKEGDTAFNNQCVNSSCRFNSTPGHKDELVNGKWIASKSVPIDCIQCGSPLPRPTVVDSKLHLRSVR